MPEHSIEPATIDQLPDITELLYDLFSEETDFVANRENQMRGVQLILENPNRGRIFVLHHHGQIFGMINLLFTISTAEGGFVMLLEDLVVHPQHRGMGYGSALIRHAIQFARDKEFLRITLLAENDRHPSVGFFEHHGFRKSAMTPMRLQLQPDA